MRHGTVADWYRLHCLFSPKFDPLLLAARSRLSTFGDEVVFTASMKHGHIL